MATFPHRYEVRLRWTGHGACGALSAPPRPEIIGGPPPQFEGLEEFWSPEHLLVGAAELCLMSTFLALARRARLAVASYESRAEGVLDRVGPEVLFTGIAIEAAVQTAPGDAARAESLLQTAKKHCIVANSLKVPVTLTTKVYAGAPSAA